MMAIRITQADTAFSGIARHYQLRRSRSNGQSIENSHSFPVFPALPSTSPSPRRLNLRACGGSSASIRSVIITFVRLRRFGLSSGMRSLIPGCAFPGMSTRAPKERNWPPPAANRLMMVWSVRACQHRAYSSLCASEPGFLAGSFTPTATNPVCEGSTQERIQDH